MRDTFGTEGRNQNGDQDVEDAEVRGEAQENQDSGPIFATKKVSLNDSCERELFKSFVTRDENEASYQGRLNFGRNKSIYKQTVTVKKKLSA